MNERAEIVHCSTEVLHRKSRSAATSQLGMSAISNSFAFRILKRTTLSVCTPYKEGLLAMEASGPTAERRRSFGTCFRSLNRGTGETSWGVDRARRARRAVHRPVEWRVEKSWNQDWDRGRFALSARISRRNPKLQRHTAAQDHTPVVNGWDLLWHVIMTLLHSPMSHRRPRQLLLNYHKAQMKKVLNHARAELMKGVRKVRYSYLIVEGEFSRLLFFLEPIFDILVQVRSHRLPSKRTLLHQSRLPSSSCRCPADSVEGMRVPCSPPYLSMLNERPLVLSNNLSPFVCASVHNFVTHVCLMVLCSWICLALCHVVK